MKAIGAFLGLGLLILTWVAVTGSSGCTTGNSNRSTTASIGESCATKQCRPPASCIDIQDSDSKGGKECYVTCSGATAGVSTTSQCPPDMVCAVPDFSPHYICIRERHGM